ncbi:hypothetical protein [Nonomuraea sp. NPDC046570]|uniref:hypothetical protein n=1 Tax=Nonomuraea sp. NPDC046570 TaxID=3155255 RepID=UPI0033EEE181
MVGGCAGEEAAAPAPAARPDAKAPGLAAALLSAPPGMKVAYGPEAGPFGSLKATKTGLEAMRQAQVEQPGCAGAGQLDASAPAVRDAPAAVVAFASEQGSITEALIALPEAFPKPPAKKCASYTATVRGTKVLYKTTELRLPRLGDESRAYLTTVSSTGGKIQIGSVAVRHGNTVMSLLAVGTKVKATGLRDQSRLAYEKLVNAMK